MNEYREAARSYAGLWLFAALLGAGFAFDLALGGGIAHLAGWILAAVLVLGLNWVVLYAVRSQKSLLLTDAELRVGDEAIGRPEIVGVTAGAADPELPVLGWPSTRPRRLRGVTVRLYDGQDVVVPTRFPDRLTAALGVGAAPEREPVRQDVRAATRAELAELPELDRRAGAVFRAGGYALPEPPPVPPDAAEPLRHAKAVFVAGRPPIGFVWVDEVDGLAHVHELAVLPKWMRQGIGGRLLERACEWARAKGYPAITLTTFADVPWNGPFYARHGFVESDDVTPGLAELRANEREVGLDEVGRRIVMRREL